MSQRHFRLVASLLTAVMLGELVLGVLALGHRHSPADSAAAISHHAGCASHSHDHGPGSQCGAPGEEQQSEEPGERPESSHSGCSICRHLAQVALSEMWAPEELEQPLVALLVLLPSHDVCAPDHLFPQPRSPPAV